MQYTYTITANKKPIHYKCPICEGNGNFLHNGYDVLCKTTEVVRYMTQDNLYWLLQSESQKNRCWD